MISQLFTYLLETSVCLAVFYVFFRLVLWKELFFTWNRMYILSALVLSLLIPAMEIPWQTSQAIVMQQVLVVQGFSVTPASQSAVINWPELMLWVYLTVSFLLVGRLMLRIIKLWYLSGKFRSSRANHYRLVLTEGKLPTFSFFRLFFWDNSRELSEENKVQVFKHELTHIRQWHSADILLAEMVKCFFWFHPAVYLFKQALQQVHEYLADAAVVEQHPAGSYIQLLLSQAFHTQEIAISTPFFQPPIKNRIMMLQKLKQARPAFWKMALSLPIVVALVFVYSCQKSDLEESQPTSKTNTTDRITTEDIFNKYRSKYPNIALESVGGSYFKDGSHTVTVTIKNVNNQDDKRKIEEELAQALKAGKLFISPPPNAPNAPDAPLADEIFQVVENQPSPVGGYEAFYKYISENITYPQQARLKGIEGRVFVQFVVYKDGSIGDVQVLKGIGEGCEAEAVRVITHAPKWNPGKQSGQPVNVRMAVPIAFKLD